MTLSEAKERFLWTDRMVVMFPQNRACQITRKHAYEAWLKAVRKWRQPNEPPLFQDQSSSGNI